MKISNLLKSALCTLSVSIVAVGVVNTANAQAYWTDSSNQMVRTGYAKCWQTIDWSTDAALAECEGGKAASKPAAKAVIGDKDGDGVKDNNDQCPNTMTGASVDSRGCMLIADTDGDGIKNNKDQCPDSAKGASVDERGCELLADSDGDGVVNAKDDCPNTAKGTATNSRGCALKASIDLSNIEFATGTAKFSSASLTELNDIAKVLVENAHMNFEVAGHTDSSGNYDRNVSLSQSRADAVRTYLINKGVASNRLTAKGYGPDQPVASNDTVDGRARNRRVDLVLQ